jgi:hypothetical protein
MSGPISKNTTTFDIGPDDPRRRLLSDIGYGRRQYLHILTLRLVLRDVEEIAIWIFNMGYDVLLTCHVPDTH